MDRNRNTIPEPIYQRLMGDMTFITVSSYAAGWMFWHNVFALLCQSGMGHKNERFHILGSRLVSRGLDYADYHFTGEDEENGRWEELLRDYRFSEVPEELGEYWKKLLRAELVPVLRGVADWLRVFREDVMPVVDRCIAQMEEEYRCDDPGLTPEALAARAKAFRAYKARLKRCQQNLELYCRFREMM